MSIINKINKLLDTKAAIKQAIIDKGVEVSDNTVFADYPSKIAAIESGGSGNEGGGSADSFYEKMWNYITRNNIDFSYLFESYYEETMDLSGLDTSNAIDMESMFNMCLSLISIDVSNFNTSKVTNMSYMFYYCTDLKTIEGLNNFNTSSVTKMDYMFNSCESLLSLDLSSFDTSEVTTMSYMFRDCKSLTTLDLSRFNTDKLYSMSYMFRGCANLTTIEGINNFNTSGVSGMTYTFYSCSSLASLDLSNWNMSKVTNASNMFNGCAALTDLKAPKNISTAIDFKDCANLTHDSLVSIINNLTTATSTKKLTLGATNLAKLTDEEKAIATGKGWTLA